MWYNERVFYQIYPLGMCGAPFENDGNLEHRILRVLDFIPHLKTLGIGAIYFSPLFESDTHGYNTRDYQKIDTRLGTNEDFKKVCEELHKNDIKIIVDGVFNHVGRGFFGFRDVLEKRWDSPYKDWFHINFDGNSSYNDGLWYEGWEGNFDLVKLNLQNPAVTDYLMQSVKFWIDEFGIDGLRLDVAYMVDREFLKRLRRETSAWKNDFFLVGETLFGDYNQIMNDEMCHSVTNYECYKGLHSALNSMNLFEIIHSLQRQFGPEPWTLYRGKKMFSFVDNHDVSRITDVLQNPEHLKLAYTMIFGMPGIPIIYYGSEWGIRGNKADGDPALRPEVKAPEWNELTDHIAALSKAYLSSDALHCGSYKTLQLTNRQCVYERETENDRVIVAVNADENEFRCNFDARSGMGTDLITGQQVDFGGGLILPPYTSYLIKPETK